MSHQIYYTDFGKWTTQTHELLVFQFVEDKKEILCSSIKTNYILQLEGK